MTAGSLSESREALASGIDLLVLDLGLPDGSAVTSLATTYLVRQSDDRRLLDAAGVLAGELDAVDDPKVSNLVADEHRETSHTGITFAVFRASSREYRWQQGHFPP